MSEDAYAKAGVSQGDADAAVASLVAALAASAPAESRQVLASGHYANVVRLNDETGIALSTDGVGTKLVLAEQLGRWDTIGIDCVAMNVNDVVCVGAEPLAMVDYLAVDRADSEIAGAIGIGLARGAALAGVEIVGGELAQLGELINGLDLAGACFGTVQLDALVTGAAIEPGDAVIGLPSSGLHSNGYTLARRALADVPLEDERLGRPLGDVLLEPTEIYVKAIVELLRSEVGRPRPRAHHLRRPRQSSSAGRRTSRTRSTTRCPSRRNLRADPRAGRRSRTRRCTRSSTWAAASASSWQLQTRIPRWLPSGPTTLTPSGSGGRLPAHRPSTGRDHEESRRCPDRGNRCDHDLRLIFSYVRTSCLVGIGQLSQVIVQYHRQGQDQRLGQGSVLGDRPLPGTYRDFRTPVLLPSAASSRASA